MRVSLPERSGFAVILPLASSPRSSTSWESLLFPDLRDIHRSPDRRAGRSRARRLHLELDLPHPTIAVNIATLLSRSSSRPLRQVESLSAAIRRRPRLDWATQPPSTCAKRGFPLTTSTLRVPALDISTVKLRIVFTSPWTMTRRSPLRRVRHLHRPCRTVSLNALDGHELLVLRLRKISCSRLTGPPGGRASLGGTRRAIALRSLHRHEIHASRIADAARKRLGARRSRAGCLVARLVRDATRPTSPPSSPLVRR